MGLRSSVVAWFVLASLPGIALAADPVADAPKVRQCSAWCVTSYRGAIPDSGSCIDSCQRGHGNHPVALCAKKCVGSHAGDVKGILACIDGCGMTEGGGDGKSG
jgi:hypothetical protein